MSEKVLVFGASGHAKVIVDILEQSKKFQIAGIVDKNARPGESFFGYAILGTDEQVGDFEVTSGIIAIGDNALRAKVVEKIKSRVPNFNFISAIHPSAVLGRGVKIGLGTVVMAGACINSDARIGRHCIVNTKASIDHDCIVSDFASIAPGATLGGNVTIGERSAIGLAASVIQEIQIGQDTVIGAGSAVVDNIESGVLAYGIPCRVVSKKEDI